MGCRRHNYWYSQGAFRCKKCGHVTYGSPEKRNKMIVVIPIIIIIAIAGYFIYQTYGMPQSIQSEASKIINNASNTVQQISSQVSQQSNSILQNNTSSLTEPTERVPIAVYDNCNSVLRTDEQFIDTLCYTTDGEKTFKFDMPDNIVQSMHGTVMLSVKTELYQYSTNDFKIGLYDQVGEKNYSLTLWQLPQ